MSRCATTRHAIIIGGGASGVLLAYQLLQNHDFGFCVTLIERRPEIGRGPAYHTSNPEHVLNVRAANMSALPDDPDHFWRWLSNRAEGPLCPDPFCFVPRRAYGDYLASLTAPFTSSESESPRLTVVHGQCVDVVEGATGVTVSLADGSFHIGDVAVLATGNESPVARFPCDVDPWAPPSTAVDKDTTVLILGTGLTMIDYVLSLLRDGHRGQIIAMSRRGLLAKAHRRTEPMRIGESDVPFGASASRLLRWLRQCIDAQMAIGGDWRSVIDAIRPYTQRLWHELPLASRRRFLEHARAWWDVHRHRTAPEVEMRLTHALAAGRLSLLAAKVAGIEPNAPGALVRYRRRGRQDTASLQVGLIVDCTGIVKDPPGDRQSRDPAPVRAGPGANGRAAYRHRHRRRLRGDQPQWHCVATAVRSGPTDTRRLLGDRRDSRHPQPVRRAGGALGRHLRSGHRPAELADVD